MPTQTWISQVIITVFSCYKHDLKKYPNRLILGSETFCKDAYSFWKIAKKNKRIIGDFVWAGWDYIGEVGDGCAEYSDYKFEDPATRMTGGKWSN